MKKTSRIICITLCVLLIALSAAGVIWALYNKLSQKQAHAEYADIVGSSDVVNFNQWVQNQYINASINDSTQFLAERIGYTNDKIYIRFTNTNTAIINFYNATSLTAQITGATYDNIITLSQDVTRGYVYYNSGNGTFSNFNIINLTQMFGSGNEPNLEEAKQYFTANYYNYSSGTPMSYNGLDNYYQAINDVFNNYTYQIDRNALNTSTYPYNILSEDSEFYYNNSNWYLFGAAAMPLFTTLSNGTSMTIDFYFYTPNAGSIDVCIASLNSDNTLTELSTVRYSFGNDGTLNFTLPFDVSTIVIYARDISTHEYYELNTLVQKLNIKATQLDVAGAILSAYDSGYQYVMRMVQEGGVLYKDIFDRGYYKGLSEQNATIGAMDYVGSAFSGIGNILSIELLPGVPFSLFVLLPLMFGLIAFVIKLSRGGD